MNVIVVGGSSKVKVSADGREVRSVMPLYKSCLDITKPTAEEGVELSALYVSYPIGDIPSEIHVYLSKVTGYPFYVVTQGGNWLVMDGIITLVKEESKDEK